MPNLGTSKLTLVLVLGVALATTSMSTGALALDADYGVHNEPFNLDTSVGGGSINIDDLQDDIDAILNDDNLDEDEKEAAISALIGTATGGEGGTAAAPGEDGQQGRLQSHALLPGPA